MEVASKVKPAKWGMNPRLAGQSHYLQRPDAAVAVRKRLHGPAFSADHGPIQRHYKGGHVRD